MASGNHDEHALSPAEERFERRRRSLGLWLGPLLAWLAYLMPWPGVSPAGQRLSAILILTIVWWTTEALPLPATSMVGAALMVVFGVTDAETALAPFANPLIFLFLGSFVLAEAMQKFGLHRRLAFWFLSLRWVGEDSRRVLIALGVAVAAASMWLSNTACTAMIYPVCLGILGTSRRLAVRSGGIDRGLRRYGTALLLLASYASNTGGLGTPVGTPPNLIGLAYLRRLAGVQLDFVRWMALAIPIVIAIMAFLLWLLARLHPPELPRMPGIAEFVTAERAELGGWSRGEKNTALAFSLAVLFWLGPGVLASVLGGDHPWYQAALRYLPEGVVAVLAAALLFVLPVDFRKREFTLSWREAAGIDWGTLLLFGGGLALGEQMFATGLAEALGHGIHGLVGDGGPWMITLVAIYTGIAVSELTSNTAAANMLVPTSIAIAQAAGVDPIPPVVGMTLGCSVSSMLPISTAPNAIVYGAGVIRIRDMVKTGFWLDLIGGLLVWIGLRLLYPVLFR